MCATGGWWRMVMVGRKYDTRVWNARTILRRQRRGRGVARLLAKKVPYVPGSGGSRARKKITHSENGEQWNGRSGAERSGIEPTQTDTRFETLMPGKNKSTPFQKMGAAGCDGGLGGTGERAHPSRCRALRGHNQKGTKPQLHMVNL